MSEQKLPDYDPWFEQDPVDDHFLRIVPRGDSDWEENGHFGDEPHHMGYILTADLHFDNIRYVDRLIKGMEQRFMDRWVKDEDGRKIEIIRPTYYRQPHLEANEYLNRDQITPLIYPLSLVKPELAESVYKHTKEFAIGIRLYFPQHWLHFQRSMNKKWIYSKWSWPIRFLLESCEIIDVLIDWYDAHEGYISTSSIIKNIDRAYVASKRAPTIMSKWHFRLLDRLFDLKSIMKRYYTAEGTKPQQAPIYKSWDFLIDYLREFAKK